MVVHDDEMMQRISRWFRRNREKDMTSYAKNILSDPTSDGNVHDYDSSVTTARAEPPSYHTYEEFDRRNIINEHDSDSFTQTCPTCGGSGKLTKGG